MEYKISGRYAVTALFEISVDYDGNNYLVIYGKHINGGFCSIPNWGIACEASDPDDTFFNYERLHQQGMDQKCAKAISNAICEEARRREACLGHV